MAKPLSFRFPDEFTTFLRTWSFVTGEEQRELLEKAFYEYTEKHPGTKEKVEQIINVMDSPK
ncbi:hypothetical protein LSG31_00210 [Fodinisporobacter ferrooxydans]|uniref:Uncharacterized protein n=1 Tax=Fodinisporobacter ferrooxydans TaxID=2901836 RepID=A0ABY4CJV7_9BACL|nr:hypothetical protein LSG31_00210 [Alicyclobacillaceae bacterium MYW30-H2]